MPIDPARLSARVREVLRGQPRPPGTQDAVQPLDAPQTAVREIRVVLDDADPRPGDAADGCVILERAYDPDLSHGRRSVGEYAQALGAHVDALALLAGQPLRHGGHAREPLLFFDLETTGLSGGVGTVAFLGSMPNATCSSPWQT